MTYAERIPVLPEPQRAAARALLAVPDDPEAIARAVRDRVPPEIVSFASGRSVAAVLRVAHDHDDHRRRLDAAIADAA